MSGATEALRHFQDRVEAFVDQAAQDADRPEGTTPSYWAQVIRNEAKILVVQGVAAYVEYVTERTSVTLDRHLRAVGVNEREEVADVVAGHTVGDDDGTTAG